MIVIDFGYGGFMDLGGVGFDGLWEKDIVLLILLEVV